jgi:antitoxin MazE
MRTRLVRIGNSQGIRIPRPVIEQVGLNDEVEMSVQDDALVIRPAAHPRAGWAEAFRKMADRGDALLDAPTPTAWDEGAWEWR